MPQLFANNAVSVLASGITAVATSLSVTPGDGAKFPTPTAGDYFLVTLFQMSGSTEINHEVVKVTARAVDAFTIVRAQEGTTARAFSAADPVQLRWTAGTVDGLAKFAGVGVFTKNQSVAAVALVDGASIAVDASLSNNFKVTLGGNRTLANPTNLTEGMVLNFAITQDGTGSRTLAYGTLYKFPGSTLPVLSTAIGAKDFMSCYYDGAILMCSMNKAFG